MAEDIKIGITATGQAEIGKQLNDTANKVNQTSSGMSAIVQKANQYFQQLTQSKNQQEQKDQQHHRKELERIQKEIEARKILLEETTGRPATTVQSQAKRTLQIQQEQRVIENLEKQASIPFTSMAKPPMRIPGAGLLGRKALGVAGGIAGLMGAYSLFSKIGGGLSEATQQGDILADAMLTIPSAGRGGGFSAARENIFGKNIKSTLKDLGQVALITGKDMKPMIEAMREAGTLSKDQAKVQIQIANEAKRMAVDPSVSGKIQVDLMRAGVIGKPSDFLGIQQGIFGTKGMSHRAEEMLQTFSETLLAVTHGPTGAGGGGVIQDLLNKFNVSGMPMYRGRRGGQLLQSLDQAFRGGGDETFELFQYQALSPMAQERNRELSKTFTGTKAGKLGSGLYDAVLSDLAQSMGAFATTESMQAKLTSLGMGDISKYFGEKFQGGQTNIERTMQTFARGMGIKLDTDTPSVQKAQFASQFAKSIGMEGREMDILAFMDILSGEGKTSFLKEGKGLSTSDQLKLATAKKEGDKETMDRLTNQATLEEIWQTIGTSLERVIVENKDAIIQLVGYVETGANAIFTLSRFLNKWFGNDILTQKEALETVSGVLEDDYTKIIKPARQILMKKFSKMDLEGKSEVEIIKQAMEWETSIFQLTKEGKKPTIYQQKWRAGLKTPLQNQYKDVVDRVISGAIFDPGINLINEGIDDTKKALTDFKDALIETKNEMKQRDKPYFAEGSENYIYLKERGLLNIPDGAGKTK